MNHKFEIKTSYKHLAKIISLIFIKRFKVELKISDEIKNLEGPFILLSNHVGTYDPFLIGYPLKQAVHYVASDAVFKDKILGFFMRNLGAIPKKKNVRDTTLIRDILTVIKRGEPVGLFPEGTRSWTGNTLPFDPSIVKLLRLLKVPVVTAKIKGMSLFNPRWGYLPRSTSKTEIEYEIALSKEDFKNLSENEIWKRLNTSIFHNEIEFQKENQIKIKSNKRAEFIDHVLFLCPKCNSIGSMTSEGNECTCSKCGYEIHVNEFGFFENTEENLYFDNISNWYEWQEKELLNLTLERLSTKSTDVIFEDKNMKIYKANSKHKFELLGKADIKFHIDRMEIDFDNGDKKIMYLDKLQTINPQLRERIELIYENNDYRFVGSKPGVSGIKYDVAANAVWKFIGQEFKLSPYIIQN